MSAYYNENNKFAVGWLKELIKANLIAPGEVDDRSIEEVTANDLKGFTQHHFFAGIGGWSLALRLALWPDSRPVWTGSCPCQSYSTGGKREGKKDARHLLPVWASLIEEYKPPVVYGEQVAAAIKFGWLDELCARLEPQGYAVGSAVLRAIAGQKGHGRPRLFFVGDASYDGQGGQEIRGGAQAPVHHHAQEAQYTLQPTGANPHGVLAADTVHGEQWLRCPDGPYRPIEPTIHLLADGLPGLVDKLCGFGNAIVPQVAAEFILAHQAAVLDHKIYSV